MGLSKVAIGIDDKRGDEVVGENSNAGEQIEQQLATCAQPAAIHDGFNLQAQWFGNRQICKEVRA